jgi:hypothetical protein
MNNKEKRQIINFLVLTFSLGFNVLTCNGSGVCSNFHYTRDSLVGLAKSYGLDSRGSIPSREKHSSLLHSV